MFSSSHSALTHGLRRMFSGCC
ncbi:BgTH12-01717 [Blumeria graminis f. sp. triticale]|uniref:BgTH12-01717 n=1 Tax=Blumeria graminis f. sp. triticale TaxID=1689686 RepID=A0A9W4D527_BLUGR|nr:BgTH12-01717 [Blumeria graminis f. sp. triticale]